MTRRKDGPGARPPRTIRLDKPGAVRVGPFRAGREYRVGEACEGVTLTPELAARLVAVKGFRDVCAAAPPADQTTEDIQED